MFSFVNSSLKLRSVLGKQVLRQYNSKINAANTKVQLTKNPKEKLPYDQLVFGRTFTDHMLTIDWDEKKGWHDPQIVPFGDISMSPAASCLHYGVECFEGLKAYKDAQGKIRLFRPDMNLKRLNYSMKRLAMPAVDDGFLECLNQLIRIDESWIPTKEGYSLYIRPTGIGTSAYLGVHPTEQAKLFVVLCPVGPYYKVGFKPIKLFADTVNVRAWPGGAGNAKVGGNYGPCLLPTKEAEKHGCSQILWLMGEEHIVTEVGAMNIFFLLKKGDGVELVTAPLDLGVILPGVTRDSILTLTRSWRDAPATSPVAQFGPLSISERVFTMKEIKEASLNGNLLEAFGAGTAAVIAPVKSILYDGSDVLVPTGENVGAFSMALWSTLYNIQYGKTPSPWSVTI